MNRKKLHKTHECNACLKENETQEHIYSCIEILKITGNKEEKCPKYERIIQGSRKDQLKIAKIFKENMKIKENFQDRNRKMK